MPNAVATLTIMVPPGKARNITLAAFAASPPVGAMIGALFAGLFIEVAEWKYLYIFMWVLILAQSSSLEWTLTYRRACLGALVFGALFFALPSEDPVDKGGEIDYIGSILGISGLALFNFAWK